MSNHEALLSFVDQLRAKGVRSYRGSFEDEVIELELGPPVVPEAQAGPPEPPHCKCGHGPHEHGPGYCLRGCEIEMCGDPTEAQ